MEEARQMGAGVTGGLGLGVVNDLDDVDYGRPIALFPLSCVTLLPHTLQPLHIFEMRYRNMIEDAIRAAGVGGDLLDAAPVAMATIAPSNGTPGCPPLRPVVCVGRMVQHQLLPDGKHNIVLHGVARATIQEVLEPKGERLYRQARLVPLEQPLGTRPAMKQARRVIRDLLSSGRLSKLLSARPLLEWIDRQDVPTHAAIELAAYAFVRDPERRYQMLAEPRALARARLVRDELVAIDHLLAAAEQQGSCDWPKGLAWN
jgi:Lon protease-like protein